jgi:methylthioribose-1-phosphate isomerase
LQIIDQRWLPHDFRIAGRSRLDGYADAIREHVGARRAADRRDGGLRHGLAMRRGSVGRRGMNAAHGTLLNATRPTAVNLRWALDRCRARSPAGRVGRARGAALRWRMRSPTRMSRSTTPSAKRPGS